MRKTGISLATLLALTLASSTAFTAGAAGVADYPKPASFPKENHDKVGAALRRAQQAAGDDLFSDFAHRCIVSPKYKTRVFGMQYNGPIEPTKIFDEFYWVGQNAVSSQALVTSEGIVLFDTLNNEDEAQNLLVPNLKAVGLDPKDIKYIVLTHGHGDHYGGATWLKKTYGATILASKADWEFMEQEKGRPAMFSAPPARDRVISDGEVLKVGNTTLQFHVTPGHTNGVLSTIFTVHDQGKPHVVGYFGGTGGGNDEDGFHKHIVSVDRWLAATRKAGADVLIANHPLHDRAIEKNELLHYRQPGDPNPYVIGKDRFQRYFKVQQECARVQLARQGVD
jgi:metallo-beta-lactamase class B